MASQLRPDGTLVAVAGVSRSGKTVWTAQRVKAARHLLVWDIKNGEWGARYGCRRVSSLAELRALVKSPRPARLAFYTPVGMRSQFDAFCRLAWVWLRLTAGVLIVEETASVTTPAKAPEAWGDICRQAMGFGCDVYAITQRPAESDKTALGNALLIHCGMMGTPRDRATMAEYLDVSADEVKALRPLQYIERDCRTHEVARGVVSIPKRRAAPTPAAQRVAIPAPAPAAPAVASAPAPMPEKPAPRAVWDI